MDVRAAVAGADRALIARTVADRVARAADVLRGADGVDGVTMQEIVDRERLRSALIAAVVLAVLSAIVILVAREIATRRTEEVLAGPRPPTAIAVGEPGAIDDSEPIAIAVEP